MKIMVTGGAGFIGSHIVDLLIGDSHKVIVVDNLTSGQEKNINKEATFYKMDIQSSELEYIFEKERPDYVSHHAAQKDVRVSVADPIYDAKINILGTLNILQNCVKYKVRRIVFASTGGAIYGEQENFPAPETHAARPISPYGITKLVAEHYMHYYKTVHGLDYTSLRYANVYGPRQDPFGEAGVVAIFIQKLFSGEQPVIYGDGGQTRDFVYVGDVAKANILAMQNDSGEHVFNIGTGVETSVNQLFDRLIHIVNSVIEKKYAPTRQGEQRRSVIDSSLAGNILKWSPEVSLEHGLKKTCEYFKQRLNEEVV